MSLNKYMHPRNPYKYKKPDFQVLAEKYPEFSGHIVQDTSGKAFLDFKNPEALRILTKTLLKEDYDLDVELPQDRLVPTIPLRLNYLLWIEDIIGKKKGVKGIDIGTGSSCIYPLLGFKSNKWYFLATDIDAQNVYYAKKNVNKNDLSSSIKVKKVTEDALITGALLDEDMETDYDFCMCNPPFFADHMEAQGLTSRTTDRAEPASVSTASPKESIAKGGEVAFVKQMIQDSLALRKKVRVYTTMVGKKSSLPPLKEELRKLQVPKYSTTEFCQGKTMRWGIAWSFDESVIFPKSHFQAAKNEKPPLSYTIPFRAVSIYEIPSVIGHIKTILTDLQIQHREKKCHKGYASLSAVAYENTWSHQRRKRRLKMREKEGGDNPDVPEQSSSKDDSGVADVVESEMDVGKPAEKSDDKSENSKDVKENVEIGSGDKKRKSDDDGDEGETKRLKTGDKQNGAGDEERGKDSANTKEHESDGEAEKKPEEKKGSIENSKNEGEGLKGSKGRQYILKFELSLKKPAGTREITLDMVWRDGDKRELMHQVMQYFKNKLKASE